MAYFPPYIDSSGIHIPTYTDTRDQIISEAKTIFGQDIYLENDSQDYQYISIIASKIYDAFQLSVLAYNNRSPVSAIGTALDSLVKLNGIKRTSAIYSTCLVVITGTANTVITNGVIADASDTKWSLPSTVTIPLGGTITVTATCQVAGPYNALVGELNKIITPTFGWTSVTNSVSAVVGKAEETDAELRAKQSVSVSIPSLSLLEGTKGAIANVTGVTRYKVYENDTNSTDSNGQPAHSITCVVEGGSDQNIGEAIFNNKSIGCSTNGDVNVDVIDAFGQTTTINFYRPTTEEIDVEINVKALNGYTTDITALIKSNLVAYLNSLEIGEDVTVSSLFGVALTAQPNLTKPIFTISTVKCALHGGSLATTDLVIDYTSVSSGNIANITVVVT